jgi:hypothetical protein
MLKSRLWRGATLVTAACGLAAALAGTGTAVAAAPAPVAVTIATKSALPKVDGDTLVLFLGDGSAAAATVSGTVTGAASGDRVTLMARKFGVADYSAAGPPVTAAGGTVKYSFSVRPGLATSYEVQVTDPSGDVTSAARTVYVVPLGVATGKAGCGRPTCHIKLRVKVKVPISAYATESAKHWYLYSRLFLSNNGKPKPPKLVELDHSATASKPAKLQTYEFAVTVRYTFRIGNHAYRYAVEFCTRDSEAKDGVGLPGHHGCGRKWVSAHPNYLG